MRILHVIPYFGPSGGGEYVVCKGLSIAQKKVGHEVTILTTGLCHYDILPGINIVAIPILFSFGPILYTPLFRKWLRDNHINFDVIHLHSFRSYQNIVVCKMKNKMNKPIIMQAHGSIPVNIGNTLLKRFFDLIFLRGMIKNLNGAIAISEKEIGDYTSIGIKENNVIMIPNGISEDDYKSFPNFGNFRKKYGINKEIKLILFVGRLHKIKGPDILIKACKIILDQKIPVHLAIVGPDCGIESELRYLIDNLGIDKSVSIIGPLYDIEKLSAYTDSDLVVIPSRYEIFSMVLLEAIMSNRPVVLTNKCSIANDFADYFLVVEPNPKSLSEAIIKELYRNKDYDNRFQRVQERILSKYGMDYVTNSIIDFYISIITQKT